MRSGFSWALDLLSARWGVHLADTKVGVWGGRYTDSDLLRNACQHARVMVHHEEPLEGLSRDADLYEVVDGAHALIVLSACPEYLLADLSIVREVMDRPLIFDCVGTIEQLTAWGYGFEYVSPGSQEIGWTMERISPPAARFL